MIHKIRVSMVYHNTHPQILNYKLLIIHELKLHFNKVKTFER